MARLASSGGFRLLRGRLYGSCPVAHSMPTWLMMSSMSLGSTPVSSTSSSVSMSAPEDTAGMDAAEDAAAVACCVWREGVGGDAIDK